MSEAPDLSVFATDNKKWARRGKRVPYAGRTHLIAKEFPSIDRLDWNDVLSVDEEGLPEGIFAMLLRDIFKYDAAPAGKDGRRADLTYEQSVRAWRRATGQDYTELSFAEAFAMLSQRDSVRTVAEKTCISKSRVDRLMRGEEPPDIGDIRLVARAYKKDPSYFLEFRSEYVLAALARKLAEDPELAAVVYRRLVRAT